MKEAFLVLVVALLAVLAAMAVNAVQEDEVHKIERERAAMQAEVVRGVGPEPSRCCEQDKQDRK